MNKKISDTKSKVKRTSSSLDFNAVAKLKKGDVIKRGLSIVALLENPRREEHSDGTIAIRLAIREHIDQYVENRTIRVYSDKYQFGQIQKLDFDEVLRAVEASEKQRKSALRSSRKTLGK